MFLYLYHFEAKTTVLGPGIRSGVWFQGCNFRCEGCLATDSWEKEKGFKLSVDTLLEMIIKQKDIEGVTISGGEPFLQSLSLAYLIKKIKEKNKRLSVMIYTGFTLKELLLSSLKGAKEIGFILKNCDILVDGRFEKTNRIKDPWRGSSNQKIYFLTKRYSLKDYKKAYKLSNEIHINKDGKIFISGIPTKESEILQNRVFGKKFL